MSQVQTGLFRLPDGMRRPRAQVIILTGPSGSGKTSLSSRVGLPSISLDHFYRDEDEPNMPTLTGDVIDWDDPRSWNAQEAFDALSQLCLEGRTEIPIYDIPSNRRTGTRTLELGDHELFIAEGILASELEATQLEEVLLADALCNGPRFETHGSDCCATSQNRVSRYRCCFIVGPVWRARNPRKSSTGSSRAAAPSGLCRTPKRPST